MSLRGGQGPTEANVIPHTQERTGWHLPAAGGRALTGDPGTAWGQPPCPSHRGCLFLLASGDKGRSLGDSQGSSARPALPDRTVAGFAAPAGLEGRPGRGGFQPHLNPLRVTTWGGGARSCLVYARVGGGAQVAEDLPRSRSRCRAPWSSGLFAPRGSSSGQSDLSVGAGRSPLGYSHGPASHRVWAPKVWAAHGKTAKIRFFRPLPTSTALRGSFVCGSHLAWPTKAL